jgi:tetratricopeptide (TPR) repeat protein
LNRKHLQIAIVIGLLFVAARMIYLSQLQRTPVLTLLFLDSEYYYQWAVGLFSGQGHPHGAFWLSPGYPIALAGLFKAIGSTSAVAIVVAQFFLSVGTLFCLGLFTKQLFGDTVALVCCGIAVLYAPWLYYDGVILSASLILLLNSLILLLIIRDEDSGEPLPLSFTTAPWIWLLIGILCGLSALARPASLLFAGLLIGLMWLLKFRRREVRIALFAIGIAVTLLPVLIRNWQVSGSLVLTTSSGGINFFIGNNSAASGVYDELSFVQSFDPEREAEGYRAEASRASGRELTLNEASRFWFLQAVRDIVEDPLAWMRLLAKKLWLTIQNEEIANNISFRGVSGFVPITGALPIRWGLLFPFAVAGAFLIWRKERGKRTKEFVEPAPFILHPSSFILLLYALSYLLVNLIFFSSSEYRFPMILALLPAAGYFFVELWKFIERKEWREVVMVSLVYLAVLIPANFPSQEVARMTKPRSDYYNMAVVATDREEYPIAIPLYARALMVDDSFKDARIGLAQSLWTMGNFDDARQEFEAAGVAPPDSISGEPLFGFFEKLYLYTEDGNYQEALDFLNNAFPESLDAPLDVWSNRAMVESELGMHDRAMQSLLKAHRKDPVAPEWLYQAGRQAATVGDMALADSLYQQSLKRHSAYAPARIALGYSALARGDRDEAEAQLKELQRIKIPADSVVMQVEQYKGAVDIWRKEHPK